MRKMILTVSVVAMLCAGCTTYQKVTFKSDPPGADITVNGVPHGKAPVTARLRTDGPSFDASKWQHKVRATLQGYQNEEMILNSPSAYWNNTQPFPDEIVIKLEETE